MVSSNTRRLQLNLIEDKKNKNEILVAKHSVSVGKSTNNDFTAGYNFDQLTLPYKCEIQIMNVGKNHTGYIDENEMQMSYIKWKGMDIIDKPHKKTDKVLTQYKMSDIKGNIVDINFNKETGIVYGTAEIYDKYIAYLMYMNKCNQVSVEYEYRKQYVDGKKNIIEIDPWVVALVKKGDMKHNSIRLVPK